MLDRNPGKGSVVKWIIISADTVKTVITEQCAAVSILYYNSAPHTALT